MGMPAPGEVLAAIIVDDDACRIELVRLVSSHGYRVAAFASVDEFLTEGDLGENACIVTDLQMPALKGIGSIPIVMIAAHSDQGVRDDAVAGGAVAVLRTPIVAAELLQALERACPNKAD